MVEPAEGTHWIIKDTGKEFVWTKHEHCVVLIGYTKDTVILSDPYDYRGEVDEANRKKMSKLQCFFKVFR